MSIDPSAPKFLTSSEVAQRAGVHRATLLRWLRQKQIAEPRRDRNGWRTFTEGEAEEIVRFARGLSDGLRSASDPEAPPEVQRLTEIDWDFADAKTNYLTHGLHPYPAKYIPQIPNAIIQELSGVGERVGDIFCGSGTTLVEALLLKRHALGVDANPLACHISTAKVTPLDEQEITILRELADRADGLGHSLNVYDEGSLFGESLFRATVPAPESEDFAFWFDRQVIEELTEIRYWCDAIDSPDARRVAFTAFSAIVVAVSKQDSDTRYVRRDKGLVAGDTLRRFAKALRESTRAVTEFSHICEPRFEAEVLNTSILDRPDVGLLDLVVCSPPYPNAYSYHLYHRTRMLWLRMDQPRFKRDEIGSHRKYSRKGRNAATVDTFRGEMAVVFKWLTEHLRRDRYACFVIGNSTINGESINNADILSDVSAEFGFKEIERIPRRMKDSAKSFNPSIGKIKTEDILILRNAKGARR